MASKQFLLEGDIPVTIYKRRANRSLRLSLGPDGAVRVTMPAWAPYQAGLSFVRSRQAWITAQRQPPRLLRTGQAIGKAHHLHFQTSPAASRPSSRINGSQIVVSYPDHMEGRDPAVQAVANQASIRALRRQAEQLLPLRLGHLAEQHGFQFAGVSIKQLRSRWGSCDHHRRIVLNLFLMQLPWQYIDYVLIHELTHTKILKHGPEFWQAMEQVLPNVKQLRKELKDHKPVLCNPSKLS